jgi:alkylated DNA repair dioxygenase AlkB
MEEACQLVEKCVNQELTTRTRFPLEYAGSEWRANVAAVNCYTGSKEGVGLHSDQLTYLGPYPTIASLSLGSSASTHVQQLLMQSFFLRHHPPV